MQDLTKILSKLTPEKRLLLEQKVLNDPEAFNAFPLSFSQRRLWFLNQLEPSSTAYNIPFAIEISGSLNIDILEKSINKIVERHEILRSVIISVKETPLQFINKQLNIRINEIDLSHLQNITDNSEINDKIKELNNSIFDLAIGPLFKCTLFKLDDNKFIFHVLMHHIISDGWSVGIFISEFSEIYNSLLNNAKPYVPELKIQYADYAKWQSEWSNSQDYQKQLDYWKNEFSNIPEPLDLPFDFQRPKIKKYNGSTSIFKLSIPDAESIGEIVKSSGTSMFMFFLSVLKVLLYKYSNSNDISIGTPIANRQKGEIQNLLGFFVNTLVIRNKIYSSRTFYDLLNNVRDKVLNSFENQEIPFETIIEQLHPDRNMGITPLFQVMFSYQKDPTSEINIENLKITPYSVENDKSKFDLSFAYDTDLFTENTIIRFVESFQGILNQVTIDSRKKISDISVLTNLDFELLRKLNDTEYSFPRTENLIQLFERNLNSYENNIAAVYENTTISYKELNERANKIARYLLKRGVRKDSIVPIIFNRSIDSIIAILSVWKAGAAYLPLVPSYPKDRIKQILDECKAKCIISNSLSVNAFDDIVSDVVLIDKNWKEIDGESSSNLSISIDPYNLSYVIYTSGSTGRPKGVMINHKSAINLAFSLRKIVYHDVKDHLKISLNAPLLFDASVQQILQLCFGDMLHIIPEETRLDSEKLLDFIRKNKLDVFDCVPTQLKFLIEEGFLDKDHWVPSKLLPGGEAIDEITWDAIRKFENSQFYNMYGPTECTVDPTICKINAETLKPSIGRPILNVHHYILNEDFEQVPIKVPGELYISGDCLSRGYYEKADLTAEKFIPDPFSKKPGSRMYSTGDKVKLNEDGNLEYLERVDDQIKLRGFRIELGEIDSALSQFEEIKQSVTILKKESKD